jgi:shikimate dehydrogenase
MTPTQQPDYSVNLNVHTKFIFSSSGSASSIVKHNNALRKTAANLVYFSIDGELTPESYAALARSPITRGIVVTGRGGLKSEIIPYLDEVEPLALKTLAVNTVVNDNGKLIGYNSDAIGLKTALEKGIQASGMEIKTAVIYGNGGVSGVAFHVLLDMGIGVTMIGRDSSRVDIKKKQLGLGQLAHFEGPYDLVVDATPVSADPHFLQAPGLQSVLRDCKMVFCHNMPEKDSKQNHLEKYCEEQNIYFIPGKWMYDGQLAKQYRLLLEGYTKPDGSPITEADVLEIWEVQ